MSRRRSPPSSARVLTRWVDAYARERGLPPKRVRDWISYMILGGRLERTTASADGLRFTVKGAVAIEMRLPGKARATKDIDLVVDDPADDELVATLRGALEDDHQGFTFRVKSEPYSLPSNAVRVDVALQFRGRSWGTIQVDLSTREGDRTEVDLLEPLDLEPFGLETPNVLPCLSLRYHLAQKIHAMTEPPPADGPPNERFRDLVDLLLMNALPTDLADVREACVEVFAIRATHDWPPVVDPPRFWEQPFAALAEEVDLPVRRIEDAIREAQGLIYAVDEAG